MAQHDLISVRSARLTKAWQEIGQDFTTLHVLDSLLDYTVDETSHHVVAGSRTEPVQCEDYWTFVRPIGLKSGNSALSSRRNEAHIEPFEDMARRTHAHAH